MRANTAPLGKIEEKRYQELLAEDPVLARVVTLLADPPVNEVRRRDDGPRRS